MSNLQDVVVRPKVGRQLLQCRFFVTSTEDGIYHVGESEAYSFGDALGSVATEEAVEASNQCQELDSCVSEVLHLVYHDIVESRALVPSTFNVKDEVVDDIHEVIASEGCLPFLVEPINSEDSSLISGAQPIGIDSLEIFLFVETADSRVCASLNYRKYLCPGEMAVGKT